MHIDAIFNNILDYEEEAEYLNGKRMQFDMNCFKEAKDDEERKSDDS